MLIDSEYAVRYLINGQTKDGQRMKNIDTPALVQVLLTAPNVEEEKQQCAYCIFTGRRQKWGDPL